MTIKGSFTAPMLQEGLEATPWTAEPIDYAEYTVQQNENYMKGMSYLTQNAVFQKLTGGPLVDKKGLWLTDDGRLYMNASMIAGEFIRSSNWDGTLAFYKSDGTLVNDDIEDENTLAGLIQQYPDGHVSWSMDDMISGSMWDLNRGQFLLKSGDQHLYFDDNGLDIAVNKLSITSPTTGINLLRNSEPKSSIEGWTLRNAKPYCDQDNRIGYLLGTQSSQGQAQYSFMCQKYCYYTLSFDKPISTKIDLVNEEDLVINQIDIDNETNIIIYSDNANAINIQFSGQNAMVYHPKLETGVQATPWVPHAEDQEPLDINLLKNTMPSEGPGLYKQLANWTYDEGLYALVVDEGKPGYSIYLKQLLDQTEAEFGGTEITALEPKGEYITYPLPHMDTNNSYTLEFSYSQVPSKLYIYTKDAELYDVITSERLQQTNHWLIPTALSGGSIAVRTNQEKEQVTYRLYKLQEPKDIRSIDQKIPNFIPTNVYTLSYKNGDQIIKWTGTGGQGNISGQGVLQFINGFREAKLQPGLIATDWREVDRDSSLAAIQNSVQASANYTQGLEYLNQQNVFDKLTNGGQQQGIFLSDGQLYINSQMIATGTIQSQNWNGTLTYEYKDSDNIKYSIKVTYDGNDRVDFDPSISGIATIAELIAKYPNGYWTFDVDDLPSGSFWDLNNGAFYLKDRNNQHLIFDQANGLDIQVNKFTIASGLGGVNMLRNSEPLVSTEGWTLQHIKPYKDSQGRIVYGAPASTRDDIEFWQDVVIEKNTYYTLSYYSNTTQQSLEPTLWMKTGDKLYSQPQQIITWTEKQLNGLYYYIGTFTTADLPISNIYDNTIAIGWEESELHEGDFIYHPKLERGVNPTDWTPHPNDRKPVEGNLLKNTQPAEVAGIYRALNDWNAQAIMYVREGVNKADAKIIEFVEAQTKDCHELYYAPYTYQYNIIEVYAMDNMQAAVKIEVLDEKKETVFSQMVSSPSAVVLPQQMDTKYSLKCSLWRNNIFLEPQDDEQSWGTKCIRVFISNYNETQGELVQRVSGLKPNTIYTYSYESYDYNSQSWQSHTNSFTATTEYDAYLQSSQFDLCFRKPKLQEGWNRTDWNLTSNEATSRIPSTTETFNSLTNNGQIQGLFMENNQLYINASYIATGILRSTNWAGNTDSDGVIVQSSEEGMAINLNTGQISTAALSIGRHDQTNGTIIDLSEGGFQVYTHEYSGDVKVLFSRLQITDDRTRISEPEFSDVGSTTTGTKDLFDYAQWTALRSTTGGALNIRVNGYQSAVICAVEFKEGTTYYSPVANGKIKKASENWISVYLKNNQLVTAADIKACEDVSQFQVGYFYKTGVGGTSYINENAITITTKKQEYTSSSRTIKGSQFDLSDSGCYLKIGGQGGSNRYIIIGNDIKNSNYALQIGKFKVDWEGNVSGI